MHHFKNEQSADHLRFRLYPADAFDIDGGRHAVSYPVLEDATPVA